MLIITFVYLVIFFPLHVIIKPYQMLLLIAGKIVVGLQIFLLLIWAYSIFLRPNGTDPAGEGTAMVLLLGMAAYIAISVALLISGKTWALIIVLVMAALPLGIAINEFVKNYGSRSSG